MAHATVETLTVEDYRALPEGPPYYQLIEGELIMSPSANFLHQVIARNAFVLLHDYLRRNPRGDVYFAPLDVFISETTVVQPDLFFISEASKSLMAADGFHGGPDLVIEIISPSNGRLEKRRKLPLYAKHGVREEWLIDPHLEQLHRYDFTVDAAKPARVVDTDESFETPLFPGLTIEVAALFKR